MKTKLTENSNLNKAIELATKVHKNQVDKNGQPYIEHCYRVMNAMDTEEEKIVAILHDVLEDSNITACDLLDYGFSYNIITAINFLTKHKKDKYLEDYITALKFNSLARKVKIADLLDNINLSRLKIITQKDINRTKKYLTALEFLINE